ncbi:hypothetical protein ACPWT1_18535 [Ramlibacter sp. MMS24-I3-19]|uniref:hypothetical protein n=1 Tax=Ramlibacter sp. MMS24-I3-19 TaxID=3416606 RepID=UPI003D08F8F0
MTDRQDNAMSDRPVAKDEKGIAGKTAATGAGAVVGGAVGGVAGGAAAGASMGSVTGPVGAAAGAVAGAVVGAVAGHALRTDPLAEERYWRENYTSRPYVAQGSKYEDYGPAYQYGLDAYKRFPDRHFDDMEPDLQREWESSRGTSTLEWERARVPARDAWERVSHAAEYTYEGDPNDVDALSQ